MYVVRCSFQIAIQSTASSLVAHGARSRLLRALKIASVSPDVGRSLNRVSEIFQGNQFLLDSGSAAHVGSSLKRSESAVSIDLSRDCLLCTGKFQSCFKLYIYSFHPQILFDPGRQRSRRSGAWGSKDTSISRRREALGPVNGSLTQPMKQGSEGSRILIRRGKLLRRGPRAPCLGANVTAVDPAALSDGLPEVLPPCF